MIHKEGKKVLLVEDDNDLREGLEIFISSINSDIKDKRKSIKVTSVGSVEEAQILLPKIEDKEENVSYQNYVHFDLLATDVMLPKKMVGTYASI